MKIKLNATVLLAVGAMAFAACATDGNDVITPSDNNEKAISIYTGEATRTVIGGDKGAGFTIGWQGQQEALGVYTIGAATNNNRQFTIEDNYSGGPATFNGTLSAGTGDVTVYGYYPYSRNAGDDVSAAKLSIPSAQVMDGVSFDPQADIMQALNQTVDLSVASSINNFRFRHLGSFVNVKTKNITFGGVSSQEEVSYVEISSAGKTLSGDFTIDLTNVNADMTFTTGADYVRTFCPAGTKLEDLDAWFVVNPQSFTASETVVIKICTEAHIITKTVNAAITFPQAEVAILNVAIDNVTLTDLGTDDGKPVGFVYFEDDFSWVNDCGTGPDYIARANDPAPTYPNNGTQIAAGVTDIKLAGEAKAIYQASQWTTQRSYIFDGYIMSGTSTNQGNFISPKFSAYTPAYTQVPVRAGIASGKTVNATLSFDLAFKAGENSQDGNHYRMTIAGNGTFVGASETAPNRLNITLGQKNTWHTLTYTIIGADETTQIRIYPHPDYIKDENDKAVPHRYFLDNFKVVKASF